MEDLGLKFSDFKKRVTSFLGREATYIEPIFEIFTGDENIKLDIEEMRLTMDFPLAACLLALWKGKRVLFLSPTVYYAIQAKIFIGKAMSMNTRGGEVIVTIAKCVDQLTDIDVIFHHGRDYNEFLPKSALRKRNVIQSFVGEDVPCDATSLYSLMCRHGERDD